MEAASAQVKTIPLSTGEEMVRCLLGVDTDQQPLQLSPHKWAYRGQADAKWRLVPSALRPGTLLGFHPERLHHTSKGRGSCCDQMNGEWAAVRQFAELADRVGLPVPGFHQSFRREGADFFRDGTASAVGRYIGTDEWPRPDILELLALAQHHGVPTRLVDFTYSPLVALFFAVDGAVATLGAHAEDRASEVAVFAVNTQKLLERPFDFAVIEVSRAANPFLHAQQGLFILDRRICGTPDNEVSLPLEEQIETKLPSEGADFAVAKFTLPADEAHRTRELLGQQGISRAHLMPTYDNVVEFLKDVSKSPEK